MLSRGWACLNNPLLLGLKFLSVKSRVSITYKLIEIKGLQLQYFGHLRKTGGRGSYRLLNATPHLALRSSPQTPASPPRLSRAPFERDARHTLNMPIFYILPTTGGRVPWSYQPPHCPPKLQRRRAHCAIAPMVRESPDCWTWKHPAAPRCLI